MVGDAGCCPQPGTGEARGKRSRTGAEVPAGAATPAAAALCPLLLPPPAPGACRGAAGNPTLPFLSCFTRPGMWLYFVLPTFAFPRGGNERASVPPIYCASREPHGCRKSRCLLLNLACCYVNLLPALMSPINTPCVSNKLAFLSLELLKADLCRICPWARPGVRWGSPPCPREGVHCVGEQGSRAGRGRCHRRDGTFPGSATTLPRERGPARVPTSHLPGLSPVLGPPRPRGPSGLCLPTRGSPWQPGPSSSTAPALLLTALRRSPGLLGTELRHLRRVSFPPAPNFVT